MEWISINQPPPKTLTEYLCTDGKEIAIMTYHGLDRHGELLEWSSSNCNTIHVFHWMPLPDLPHE